MNKTKKRKGTIHSVDPVLFQRYLNSQEDHVLATLISEFGFKPSMMFKSSALWKHYIKWQKTDGLTPSDAGTKIEIIVPNYDNLSEKGATLLKYDKIPDVKYPIARMRNNTNAIHSGPVINGPAFEDGV